MSQCIRILHVVTHMNRGGLETMIMNYYRHTDRSRVQFDFLVHRDYEADYDAEILALGGRIYRLPPLNPLSRHYLAALDGFFAEHEGEYPIVHCHLDCMAGIPLKYARKHGVRLRIAHAHSSSQTKDLKYPLKLWYRSRINAYANARFACGAEAGQWMFRGAEFRVLNNAIDARLYAYDPKEAQVVRRELGIAEDMTVVGHVGRFCHPKNHGFLVEVFAHLAAQCPGAVLLLVGRGELENAVREQVHRLGLDSRVIFAGLRSDVHRVLQAMDVFVFPSVYEGLPLSIVEAQAAGLPCLISDGVPEECIKTDRVTRLALADGAKRWAQAVLRLAEIPKTRTLEQIEKSGFDIRSSAQALQQFYEDEYRSVANGNFDGIYPGV